MKSVFKVLVFAGWVMLLGSLPVVATPAANVAQAQVANSDGFQLPATQQYAHKVVSGALGPWSQVQVRLIQSAEVDDAPFSGEVVIPSDGQDKVVHKLPPVDETEAHFMTKVLAVMFRNVDQAAQKELIVLYIATRIGPRQPSYFSTCVYKWDGAAFVRVPKTEAHLKGAKTAKEGDRRLSTLKTRRKE